MQFPGRNCEGMTPAFFFPVGTSGRGAITTDELEKEHAGLCNGEGRFADYKPCKHKSECLELAIAGGDEGVYGGTSTAERISIRKKRKMTA